MSRSERSWRGRSVGGRGFGHGLAGVLALAGALVSGLAVLGEEGFVTEDFEDQEVGAFPSGWSDLADVVSPQEEVLVVVRQADGPQGDGTHALELRSRYQRVQGIHRRVLPQKVYRIQFDVRVEQDMPRDYNQLAVEVGFSVAGQGDSFQWNGAGVHLGGLSGLHCIEASYWNPVEQNVVEYNVPFFTWFRVSFEADTERLVCTTIVEDPTSGQRLRFASFGHSGLSGMPYDTVFVSSAQMGVDGTQAVVLIDNIVYSDTAEGYFPEASCAVVDPPEECYLVGQIVQLDGSASTTPEGSEIVSWEWDFGDDTTGQGVTANHAYSSCGRYEVALLVTNDKGGTDVAKSAVCVVAPLADPAALVPWTAIEIGTPGLPGGIGPVGPAEPGCYALCAGGRGLVGTADECLFLGRAVEGHGTISAHVAYLAGGANGAGVGVMVRGSLEPDAAFVAVCVETRSGDAYQCVLYYRLADGGRRIWGGSLDESDDFRGIPCWVRLQRTGDHFVGEVSEDGSTWRPVGEPVTVPGLDAPVAGAVAYARVASTTTRFTGLEARVCALEWTPAPPGGPAFRRGDSNCDGSEDLSDATSTFNHLFLGGEAPCCLRSADVNRDDALDISDGVALLNFLFLGGEAPAEPFGACGRDDDATLGCERYPPCP